MLTLLDPILSHYNPINIAIPYSFINLLIITFASTPRYSMWPLLFRLSDLSYSGRIFTLLAGSTVLRFTEAGEPLAARRMRILSMNQHA
jgi:hypothetical protein